MDFSRPSNTMNQVFNQRLLLSPRHLRRISSLSFRGTFLIPPPHPQASPRVFSFTYSSSLYAFSLPFVFSGEELEAHIIYYIFQEDHIISACSVSLLICMNPLIDIQNSRSISPQKQLLQLAHSRRDQKKEKRYPQPINLIQLLDTFSSSVVLYRSCST